MSGEESGVKAKGQQVKNTIIVRIRAPLYPRDIRQSRSLSLDCCASAVSSKYGFLQESRRQAMLWHKPRQAMTNQGAGVSRSTIHRRLRVWRHMVFRVTLRAAVTAAPLEMPTKRPSSLANLFAMAMLSSLLTCSDSGRHARGLLDSSANPFA